MPAGHSTGRPRRTVATRAGRRAAERRRRLRRTLLLGSAAVLVAVSATAYAMAPGDEVATVADSRAQGAPGDQAAPAERPAPSASATPSKAPRAATGKHSPSPSPSASASASAPPPAPAPGGFAASSLAGLPQGKGPVRRWRLEVEEGSGVDANTAARAVEAILGDPRGWIHDPAYGFQLAGAGQPVDFTVKIATPTTTDLLCEVVTPELKGETNCRAGHTVVVNLKRWQEGSPQFAGPVEQYRALIVNHEVGHELGHEHETCPGPGQPAPAMMQQIKGLLGCTANAWPFDGNGTYLSGPRVP
ncbi:DUF3152 domain-containing protein [Streptomyces sp. NPDC060028]|uniref:DUF3152 domain-containing protein n=1 Tax=Streptomyces sp. NPDC060028 TaxID=3347041 RepID=UPI0036C6E93C